MSHEDALTLVRELEQRRVELMLEGTQLRYRAPHGAISEAHRSALRELKAEVIALLKARTAQRPRATDSSKATATWRAAGIQELMIADPDTCNVECGWVCQGEFDVAAARESLSALLGRHGILRSHYSRSSDGELWVVTEPSTSAGLVLVDLRALPESLRGAEVIRLHAALIRRRFDRYRGPLFTCVIIRWSDHVTRMMLVADHSICDAVSQSIISQELETFYRCAHEGRPSDLVPVPVEYGDFVREQRAWLASKDAQKHIRFWRERFSNSKFIFKLPYDRSTPLAPDDPVWDVTGRLRGSLVAKLKLMASAEHTTMLAVFATLLCCVLTRWSERADVAMWICHSGRAREDLQYTVGCFIDHWLLRLDVPEGCGFTEALRQVHARCVEAAPHLEVSHNHLMPDLAQLSEGQICPGVVLNYMPRPGHYAPPYDTVDEASAPRASGGFSKDSALGVIVNCIAYEDELHWAIRYNGHLFESHTIERVSRALAELAGKVSHDPERSSNQGSTLRRLR